MYVYIIYTPKSWSKPHTIIYTTKHLSKQNTDISGGHRCMFISYIRLNSWSKPILSYMRQSLNQNRILTYLAGAVVCLNIYTPKSLSKPHADIFGEHWGHIYGLSLSLVPYFDGISEMRRFLGNFADVLPRGCLLIRTNISYDYEHARNNSYTCYMYDVCTLSPEQSKLVLV